MSMSRDAPSTLPAKNRRHALADAAADATQARDAFRKYHAGTSGQSQGSSAGVSKAARRLHEPRGPHSSPLSQRPGPSYASVSHPQGQGAALPAPATGTSAATVTIDQKTSRQIRRAMRQGAWSVRNFVCTGCPADCRMSKGISGRD